MKQYKFQALFKKGYLMQSRINLVKNDYNSTEFIFEFDIEDGRNVFEMKCPNGEIYVKDIIDNKIKLVDYGEKLNPVSLIPIAGTYEFEIAHYDKDEKLTLQEHGYFTVRDEVVEVNNSEIENDNKFPILDSLINDVEKMKDSTAKVIENTNKNSEYAKEQGDYAKEQAKKITDSNSQATEIINNFEEDVDTYTSNFNTNSDNKLKDYNENHTKKLNAYDTNASNQVKSYNDNATSKINEYDTNHTNKLKTYNDNTTEKTTAYNSNHDSKMSTYNDNATQKETDFNTNAETKVTEYNENHESKMSAYNENAEAKVNEFNEEVETLKDELSDCYRNQLIGQAEGTSIQVKDSADARMRILEIDGALERETTKGINLLKCVKTESETINGVTFTPVYKNGSLQYINVNGTSTENTNYYMSTDTYAYNQMLTAGTYTLSDGKIGESSTAYFTFMDVELSPDYNLSTAGIKTMTLPQDSKIKSRIVVRSGITLNNVKFYPMLEKGIEASPYEPYTGGQASPNPDYPQEIEVLEGIVEGKVVNKNYFDYNYPTITTRGVTFEYDENTNEVIINGTPENNYISWFTNHIDLSKILENGKTYTLSNSKYGTGIYAQIMQKSKSTGTITNIHTRDTSRIITIDFENYDYTINIMTGTIETVGTLSNFRIKFQLENGNKATEIIPYQEETVEIDLQGNFVAKLTDEIKDTLKIENGHAILTKRIGKGILDGSGVINIENNSERTNRFRIGNFTTTNNKILNSISTHFIYLVNYTEDTTHFYISANGNMYILISKTIAQTVEEFKIWLSEHPVTFYYELAEPYDIDLGPFKLPKTFKGISNIFLNANLETNFKVEYVKDTQSVVDNLQNQIDSITTLLSTSSTSALLLDNLQSDLESEVI